MIISKTATSSFYYADGTRVLEPDNRPREVDLRNNLPDPKGGDLAATDLNALFYSVNDK